MPAKCWVIICRPGALRTRQKGVPHILVSCSRSVRNPKTLGQARVQHVEHKHCCHVNTETLHYVGEKVKRPDMWFQPHQRSYNCNIPILDRKKSLGHSKSSEPLYFYFRYRWVCLHDGESPNETTRRPDGDLVPKTSWWTGTCHILHP